MGGGDEFFDGGIIEQAIVGVILLSMISIHYFYLVMIIISGNE